MVPSEKIENKDMAADNGGQGAARKVMSRTDIRMRTRAIVQGWVDDQQLVDETRRAFCKVMQTAEDSRSIVAAAEGVVRIVECAQRIAEFDDKTERLDRGDVTERTENITVVFSEDRPPAEPAPDAG